MSLSRYNGNQFYFGDVDDAMEDLVIPLIRELQRQNDLENGQVDLWINSFGGYLHVLEFLIETIEVAKGSGIIVRTIVPSTAFSAGSMLAIAGTQGERYIGKDGEHLAHFGQMQSLETTINQVERLRAFKHRQYKKELGYYRKYADIPNLEENFMDDGFFIPASKCIQWKLADKYMAKFKFARYIKAESVV